MKDSLTLREKDVVACLISGRSSKTIASFLGMSPRTAETHIRSVMIKCSCGARDHLIELVERSDSIHFFRKHYISLLHKNHFKEALMQISQMHKRQPISIMAGNLDKILLDKIVSYLKVAKLHITVRQQNLRPAFIYEKKKHEPIVYLLQSEEALSEMKEYVNFGTTASHPSDDFYLNFFELLKILLPTVSLDGIITKCMSHFDAEMSHFDAKKEKMTNQRSQAWHYPSYFAMPFFVVGIILVLTIWIYLGPIECSKYACRFEPYLPQEKLILDRSNVLTKIEDLFKKQTSGIKYVTLVGIGGAGKTILARYYGSFVSQTQVVWELNAEKVQSLISSFEDFAQALAKKSDQRNKQLDAVLNISNIQAKQKQLLSLIKAWLKEEKSWLLIYDNVENIVSIKDSLPQDSKVWGHGNVIITTRNTNIQNTDYLAQSDIVTIEELTDDEKLTLFSKFYYHKLPDTAEAKKAKDFLKKIPPFPLDVSSAACYLKLTNTSFDQYTKNLQNPSGAFEKAQEILLKEKGTYTKTRYSIITTSMQRIIDMHEEFSGLALFIGLLDSQNIPKALLEHHNQSVDEFIVNLKKYSLITSEKSSLLGSTFSIHRSTQAIILAYLIQKLDLAKNKEPLVKIAKTLEDYMSAILDRDDYMKPKLMLDHYETFLGHSVLGNDIVESMGTVFGGIYCELEQYNHKTEQLLKNAIKKLEKHGDNEEAQIKMARAKTYLGDLCSAVGLYIEGKNLLDDSLKIYQKYPKKQSGMGKTLRCLGIVYRRIGRYKEAIDYLQESIKFFEKNMDNINIAHSNIWLGLAYMECGQYKQAKNLIEGSVNFYKNDYPEHDLLITWGMAILSEISTVLGCDISKSKGMLENNLAKYIKYYGSDHPFVAWWSLILGNVYREGGDYEKAKNLIKESLVLHRKYYSNENIDIGLNPIKVRKPPR